MNHIIFGGEGFIGQNLTKFLNALNIESINTFDLKNDQPEKRVDVRMPIETKIYAGLGDAVIYNLAAIHVTPGHLDHEYFEANVLGAKNICNFAKDNKINTIVFTSSIAVYGTSEALKSEDSLPMPSSSYGISKLTAEYIHKLWQAEDPNNRKLIILRPGAVFGKSENGNFVRLYQSIKKGNFFYPGRKDTKKACVYVKDVVNILYRTAQEEPTGVHIYNLCFSQAPTIETICQIIATKTGLTVPQLTVPPIPLKIIAKLANWMKPLNIKQLNGIHPERVSKLMVSTNISGDKLANSSYKLKYTLKDAIVDWFNECEKKGLF